MVLIKKILRIFTVLCFCFTCFAVTAQYNTVYAEPVCTPSCCCCSCAGQVSPCSNACGCESDNNTATTIEDVLIPEFIAHREWLIAEVFEGHVLPSMMLMAHEISVMAMHQMLIIGTFFDAKHQLESQQLLQELQAQAHKDYHPSVGMCRIGTNTRSLARADSNVRFNKIALAARHTQRTMMNIGAIGTGGEVSDSRTRLAQFRNTYCNPNDFGNSLDLLCVGGDIARRNEDINFTHNIDSEDTLRLNFSDDVATEEEEDVLALSANLYGNQLLPVIPQLHLAGLIDGNFLVIDEGIEVYMQTRALAAKRSVAFNSFAAQAALKASGGETVTPYMTALLETMGVPLGSIETMLKGAPSYHAQMEFLTKQMYQFPHFYSDLYDKPVNVDRRDVAMNAIGLMQKRDIYHSQLRSEANMAIWLETIVEDLQEFTANEIKGLKQESQILDLD